MRFRIWDRVKEEFTNVLKIFKIKEVEVKNGTMGKIS